MELENDREVLEWMVFHCDAGELAEFLQGLQEFNGRPDREKKEVQEEFEHWYSSWIVSMRLHIDSNYQRQVKDSLARQRRLEWGLPVDAEGLKNRSTE